MQNSRIPVVDTFAGPGGLGEGFASFEDRGFMQFAVQLSIEKDVHAANTLRLRAFYRQFLPDRVPSQYYQTLAGHMPIEELASSHPAEWHAALQSVWQIELGRTPERDLDNRIETNIGRHSHWVLLGGPPCQAYSIAGRSRMSRIWRETPEAKESDERHYLYTEYLRIIAVHQPAVFVMENVKGILTARLAGERIFVRIVADLSDPGRVFNRSGRRPPKYKLYSFVTRAQGEDLFSDPIIDPQSFLIEAEKYGVPQQRHRVIILGVREDIETVPKCLSETRPSTVREAIADLPHIHSRVSGEAKSGKDWTTLVRKYFTDENNLQRIPDELVRSNCRRRALQLTRARGKSPASTTHGSIPTTSRNSLSDPNMSEPWNHEPRAHMPSDFLRYFYCSCFAEMKGYSPLLRHFPASLLPAHRNTGNNGGRGIDFEDRFRVQIYDFQASTITAHIAKDGHHFIHPDPLQCRSLSVREAARLQTFPDNYYFTGHRTHQYVQVGNAVPPLLARGMAAVVHEILKK